MFESTIKHKRKLWWFGSIMLVVPVLLYTYFLMPFPGSQDTETISFCYKLNRLLPYFTFAGIFFLAVPVIHSFLFATLRKRMMQALWCLLLILFYGLFVKSFKAEVMFKEPTKKIFSSKESNKVSLENIVIGLEHNGEAKAYPVNYIGYHHTVQDSVGGKPVMVTYCTMCRTGRVYNPVVNGNYQTFRLVGARHYNAVVEDSETKTWWYQATGIAAAGMLKGKKLHEIFSQQMSLQSWLEKYPQSLIMQPDNNFLSEYDELKNFDTNMRVGKDSVWERKNWIVGIVIDSFARAYDWNYLKNVRIINDRVGEHHVIIFLENDLHSFHVWKAGIKNQNILFKLNVLENQIEDTVSGYIFRMDGKNIGEINSSATLVPVQSYQEYWHSWKYFHPNTTQFSKK